MDDGTFTTSLLGKQANKTHELVYKSDHQSRYAPAVNILCGLRQAI